MAASNTVIGRRIPRKTDSFVVETILAAKKQPKWKKVAQKLSGSRKQYLEMNLNEIDSKTKEGDIVIIPGKVLGNGNLSKKIKICAMAFSNSAIVKIKHLKGETTDILQEIKTNPKAEGVKVL